FRGIGSVGKYVRPFTRRVAKRRTDSKLIVKGDGVYGRSGLYKPAEQRIGMILRPHLIIFLDPVVSRVGPVSLLHVLPQPELLHLLVIGIAAVVLINQAPITDTCRPCIQEIEGKT